MGGFPVTVEGRTKMDARIKLARALEKIRADMNMFAQGSKEVRYDHKKKKWVGCAYIHT